MAVTRHTALVRAAMVAALALALLPLIGRGALVEATSWIDAPLDGAVLPLAPYTIVAHSADQGGVAAVFFEVDGVRRDARSADGGSRLLTSRFEWDPPAPGTYVLSVRARNTAGGLGEPANATVVVTGDAPSVEPTLEPGASQSLQPTLGPGETLGPDQTPGPTGTPRPSTGATPGPTPTKKPTPAPTFCNPPTAILDQPSDFEELDYPSEAQPLFEWHYSGGTGCLASQVLHIYNLVVGVDLTIDLGAGARSYQQRSDFPWDPDNTGDRSCAHYQWVVTAFNADGEGEPGAPGSFKVCELNPDA